MCALPADIVSYLSERLEATLPGPMRAILWRAAQLAGEHGWQIYLVGGYLRDLLLKLPDYDVDVSVVGDAVSLARWLAAEARASVEVYERFGTATLYPEGVRGHIDFVTARHEWYEAPGALPSVRPGSIYDDLARRDFTINAMALTVTLQGVGPLLDPHGGLPDLEARLIRVLHDRSFLDDPTRIFRAVKLAVRLGFTVEPHTLDLLKQAVHEGALRALSVDRITNELLLVMKEHRAARILTTLRELGVLRAIHPDLDWPYPPQTLESPPAVSGLAKLTPEQRQSTLLALLGAQYPPRQAEQIARYLRLTASHIRLVRDAARLAELRPRLAAPGIRPSDVYSLLKGLDPRALEACLRLPPSPENNAAWERVRQYLEELRYVRPELDGTYLRALGLPPGPLYRRILDALRAAKLDGLLPTREHEERFVAHWLTSHRDK